MATAVLITATIIVAHLLLLQQPLPEAEGFAFAWADDKGISTKDSRAPMAISGEDNVYVVWWANRTGNWEVVFRASNDGGATFSEGINLSNSAGDSSDAAIATAENYVYVAWWEQDPQSGIATLSFRVSDDNGQTFGEVMNLTNATQANIAEFLAANESMDNNNRNPAEVQLAAAEDNVYGVVTGQPSAERAEATDVFFGVSNDNGQTFSAPVNLSESPTVLSNDTELAAAGDNVYVSWWERANETSTEPVMRVSNDEGQTFGPILRLPANGTIIGSTTAITDETEAAAAATTEEEEA